MQRSYQHDQSITTIEGTWQSVWYDNIDRAQLLSGLFQRLIDEDGIAGTTANPTIFEQSISKGTAYDEQIRQLFQEGKSTNEIYEALVMTDVRMVADKLRPVYERTNKQDGYVSLEISPTCRTIPKRRLRGQRFWNTVDRPNLLVKIPATPAGIPAIRQASSEGININITLIFALENYRQVVEAYLRALEERSAKGQDISHIASVASFFVSRVDVLVDPLLEERIAAVGESVERQKLKALLGQSGHRQCPPRLPGVQTPV